MILSDLGAFVLGNSDLATMVKSVVAGVGVILVGFGLRNALEDLLS